MEYFRTGPTPCVSNSQQSSNSIGDPQLPICTNSQGYSGAAEALLIWLIIGAVAGFLAGVVVKGYGFGIIGNIIVGIIGAVVAGSLLPQLGVYPGTNITGQIISATLGAIVLLVLIGLVRRVA